MTVENPALSSLSRSFPGGVLHIPKQKCVRCGVEWWDTHMCEKFTGLAGMTHDMPLTKPMILATDPVARKSMPISTGVLDYFPLALAEVAVVSKAGNDQHNPGQPLHWDKTKSLDHADCIARHLIDRGARDTDGMRHSAKLAWRALALLQTELDAEAAK